jgi:hypothetical protein
MSKKKKIRVGLSVVVALGLGWLVWSLATGGAPRVAAGQVEEGIILFTGENFTGRSLVIEGSLYDFPLVEDPDGSFFDWNDQVRSVIVASGTWRFYQHGRLNTELDDTEVEVLDVRAKAPREGWCALLSAGESGALEIPNLAAGGIGPDISSIELVSTASLPGWAQTMRHR